MATFNDFTFEPTYIQNLKCAQLDLANGYRVILYLGEGYESNGIDTYALKLFIPSYGVYADKLPGISDSHSVGNVTAEEVNKYLEIIEKYPECRFYKNLATAFGHTWEEYQSHNGKKRVPDIISYTTMAITLVGLANGVPPRRIADITGRSIQSIYYARERVIKFCSDPTHPLVAGFLERVYSIDEYTKNKVERYLNDVKY